MLSPFVTATMGCNGLKNVTKGLRDVKEGGISARKAGLLWGLSMKKSTLHVRLNRNEIQQRLLLDGVVHPANH